VSPKLRPWVVAGSYLEACSCEAICPCRQIGGVPGGRSTYGICMGVLSWHITDGRAGSVELTGLNAALALRYDDDEKCSPWDHVLYIDERADDDGRHALTEIFSGDLGGSALEHFPWAWKPSRLLGVRPARIELDHTSERGWLRVNDVITLRIAHRVSDQPPVTCGIPGHHRDGDEVVAEELIVADEALNFEFAGRCGYRSSFEYTG
jgi:hypothetical protein